VQMQKSKQQKETAETSGPPDVRNRMLRASVVLSEINGKIRRAGDSDL